jgi:hypothetical protein
MKKYPSYTEFLKISDTITDGKIRLSDGFQRALTELQRLFMTVNTVRKSKIET